jgi:dTDP-4-amino-4,6-dideoxygalactose transaminase
VREAVSTERIRVPFLDLAPMHTGLVDDIVDDFRALALTGAFTNGPQVAEFEEAFASYCGAAECVGLASGLDALRLALECSPRVQGGEVLLPANTFVATFEAVVQAGAVPVPVDVSESDYNIDVEAAAAARSARTEAILPVHLYGQLADMRALSALGEQHGLFVLEDACQAHGAERDGLRAGAIGDASAFSFYPGKNLGAFGDAGALTTNDAELAERVRMLREHGQRAKYRHELVGYTARLDTVQALVLLHKLRHLDAWNAARRDVAHAYDEGLSGVGDLTLPPVPDGSTPVWHLYVVRTSRRDALADHLRERGLGVGLHYPEPAHLSAAFASLGHRRGAFPVTEALAEELLSLPIFPGMTDQQIQAVVDAVGAFYSGG